MGGFAYVHNLGEAVLWTAGGTNAKPRLEWSALDLDAGDGVAAYWVRIYNASSGTEGDGSQVYSSGEVAGNPGYHDANYGMPNKNQASAERWWTIKAKDNSGEWSAESSRTSFKVNWAQAIYEHNVGVGAGSLEFASGANIGANTQQAFIFRNAGASGATPTAWQTAVGAVPTGLAYINVAVRIATQLASGTGSGNQPGLPDMTLSWQSAAQQPDNWTRTPSAAWSLDTQSRRYGSKSYKCVVASAADHYVEPFRVASNDGIPVAANTHYVFSGFVRTNALLTGTHVVRLEVRDFAGFATSAFGSLVPEEDTNDPGVGATQDTSAYPEQWQRIHLHYESGPTESLVRPIARYVKADGTTPDNTGDVFWFDCAQWEEGEVVSAWKPGFMSPAMTFDSYGLQMNAVNGGNLQLQTANDSVNIDDVVNSAGHTHVGSGTPEGVVTAPIGHIYLRSDGSTSTTLYVKTSGSGNTGWTAK